MSLSAWIWTHASLALILTALSFPKSTRAVLSMLAAAMLITVIPLGETDVNGHLLPCIGNLSVGSLMGLMLTIQRRIPGHIECWNKFEESSLALFGSIIGGGLLVSAFGFLAIDVYAFGYGSAFAYAVGAASILALVLGHRFTAVYLLASIVAWQHQIVESANLWDYLVDPWFTICCVAMGFNLCRGRINANQMNAKQIYAITNADSSQEKSSYRKAA